MKKLFLERPADWMKTQRQSIDACRDACAIEKPAPRMAGQDVALILAGILAMVVIFLVR